MVMPTQRGWHEELETLKREIEALRQAKAAPAAGESPPELETQIGELTKLVHTMLDEAEDTVTRHPVATVAGALALGIVIGRLTAR